MLVQHAMLEQAGHSWVKSPSNAALPQAGTRNALSTNQLFTVCLTLLQLP
jgi:hypothetical protein